MTEGGIDFDPNRKPVSAEEAEAGTVAKVGIKIEEGIAQAPEKLGDFVEAGGEKAGGSLEAARQALDDAWRELRKKGSTELELQSRARRQQREAEETAQRKAEKWTHKEVKRREAAERREEGRSKRKKALKKASPWFIPAGLVGLFLWLNSKVGLGAQEAEESGVNIKPSPEENYEAGKDIELEAYAAKGVDGQIGYPNIKGVNDPEFLTSGREMMVSFAAKYGASFLFSTYSVKNEDGIVIENLISPVLLEEMAQQTGYSVEYLRSIWLQAGYDKDPIIANTNREFALQVLQQAPKPVDPKKIQFFQEADRLIDNNPLSEFSQDRREDLIKWIQEYGLIDQGKEALSVVEEAVIFNNPDFASTAREITDRFGIDAGDLFGVIAGAAGEWRNQPDAIAQQLQAVEAVAAIYPEEKLALYAGLVGREFSFFAVCGLIGMVMLGRVSQRLPTAQFPKVNFQVPIDKLTVQLVDIGRKVLDNLQKNSQEFRDWIEELKSRENAKKLERRLSNGLSLSRNPEVSVETMLVDSSNKDLRDLVLNMGLNWFGLVPENHPEAEKIMKFFGCRSYQELQELAGQQDRVVNRLYKVLVGSGKQEEARKAQHKGLIELYKRARGFSVTENQ